MNQETIPDNAVNLVAYFINERSNKNYSIKEIIRQSMAVLRQEILITRRAEFHGMPVGIYYSIGDLLVYIPDK